MQSIRLFFSIDRSINQLLDLRLAVSDWHDVLFALAGALGSKQIGRQDRLAHFALELVAALFGDGGDGSAALVVIVGVTVVCATLLGRLCVALKSH